MRRIGLIGLCLAICLLVSDEMALGQMFGSRSLGRPLRRGAAPGLATAATAGQVTGAERFLRGNRRAGDIVGTDSRDNPGFIGIEQGSGVGAVRSAVSPLRGGGETDTARVPPAGRNRQLPYAPRLTLDFDYEPLPEAVVSSQIEARLAQIEALSALGRLEVLVEGRTATLRGTVASPRARALAEQLVRLEPGVESVRNELSVIGSPDSDRLPADAPPAR